MDIPSNFSGECAIFVAGTGILPFTDLLDFLLKKSIYTIFKKKKLTNETYQIKPVQDYSKFYPNAKFKLFGGFRTLEDFVGWEWIEKLYEINDDYELGFFDCLVRFSDSSEMQVPLVAEHFDEKFIERNVMREGKSVDKVIICGPPKFMEDITEYCTNLGYPSSKIHYI